MSEDATYRAMSDTEKIVQALTHLNQRKISTSEAEQRLVRVVANARIEEIEDVDQSRSVVTDPDGTIWCMECQMELDGENERCACNVIYSKRKNRLEQLRKGVLA